ncbi:hypothetical protein C3L33_03805, partial [Rhododendron williamsianum]
MANQSSSSSSYPILCASFNQDNSCFAIGTRDGFKIFDSNTGRLCYERGNYRSIHHRRDALFFKPSCHCRSWGTAIIVTASSLFIQYYNWYCPSRAEFLDFSTCCLYKQEKIDAHRSPLAAMVLSSNGMYIATASEQGTIIRVHLVSEATKSYNFRRGTYPSTIFSLSFGPSMQHPDTLVATSSSGSVHAFSLGFNINQSYAVIRKVDKVADSIAESVACSFSSEREFGSLHGHCIHNHFQWLLPGVYLKHQPSEESSWILEREFNLLTVISEGTINS